MKPRLGYWQRIIGRNLTEQPQSVAEIRAMLHGFACDFSMRTTETTLASMVRKEVAALRDGGYVRGPGWADAADKFQWK